MKRVTWLAASFVLNIVFVALLLLAYRPGQPPAAAPAPDGPAVHPDSNVQKKSPAETVLAPVVSPVHTNSAGWRQWSQALREAGVPEKVIRETIEADFEDRWQRSQDDAERRFERGEIGESALADLALQHDDELEKQMRAALGEDGFRQWQREKMLGEIGLEASNLTADQISALCQMRKDFDRRGLELQQAHQDGTMDDVDFNAKNNDEQAKYDQQLKGLLGDDQYAALQNNNDTSARDLRRSLGGMQVTDQQFAALVKAQQQWNQANARLEQQPLPPGQDSEQQQQAVNAARDQAFQQALGPDGYAQYQKAQDTTYQALNLYKNAWQLSDSDIDYLYSTYHNYQQSIQDFRQKATALEQQGYPVNWDDIQQDIQNFSLQNEQALRTYLGNDRFAKLQQNSVLVFEN